MDATTKERMIGKLPKWAQEYIANLENTQRNAIAVLERSNNQQTESNVYVEEAVCNKVGGGITYHKHYIQSDSVCIKTQNTSVLRPTISFRSDKDGIRVMAGNQLIIEPVASNVVILNVKE